MSTLSTIATIQTSLSEERSPQRCQLVVIDGPDMGRAVSLDDGRRLVGTDRDCELRLSDGRVSGRHLAVEPEGAGFLVQDLGSRNGTVHQGARITEAVLRPGATVKLGRSILKIQPVPRAIELAPSQARRFGELVGESLAMREVFAVLELAAASPDVTVLLEGETGVGKELAARAIHEASDRRRSPFVAVDCSALPEGLVDSELFGHVKGAFTGATASRKGAFQRASGGTLLLDEIGTIPSAVEARLLRVIEERLVRPVGADAEREVDVRLVAASRQDLLARVTEGTFRPDLYYRLSVIRVALPPLRQRREDIEPIVIELLGRRGFDASALPRPALDRLFAHDWPGNVRELRNVVDRALALSPGAREVEDLRLDPAPAAVGAPEPLTVRADLPFTEAKQQLIDEFERRYLGDLLDRCGGNLSEASRQGSMDRKHLRQLARRHGLIDESS